MRHVLALLLAASVSTAIAGAQPSSKTRAFDPDPRARVYFQGRPVDAILLPDGSVAYLLKRPPSGTRPDPEGPWVLIAHPVRDRTATSIDPITGRRVAVGTDPDGTYHGFAWFVDRMPDVVESEDGAAWTPVYETDPSRIEEWRAGRTAPSPAIQDAAVQRWWARWDDWLENLTAGDLAPHTGIVSGCRDTEAATVVTMKGDGTFQFLYRNRDRITFEGPQASDPCDFLGRRVTVWTLPCEDGPCIRKIQAIDGPIEPPPASVEPASDAPVPHPGVIAGCRPGEGATIVTVKGSGSFQFLYRERDRVVDDGAPATSPCELVGRNVIVWTIACDEDAPCISRIERAQPPP